MKKDTSHDHKISFGTIAGTIILAFWFASAVSGFHYIPLVFLENFPIYKGVTGLAIYLIMIFQFRLSLRRFFPVRRPGAAFELNIHKNAGNWIPLLFALHTQEFGYGLNLMLNISIVSNLLVSWYGLLLKGKWHARFVSLHIILSLISFSLATYHLIIAISYH